MLEKHLALGQTACPGCRGIKLVKLLECTGVYCQFEFAIIKILGFEHENSAETKTAEELDSMWTLL